MIQPEQMNFPEQPEKEPTLFDRAVEIFLEKRKAGQSNPNPIQIIRDLLGREPKSNEALFTFCAQVTEEGKKRWSDQFLPKKNETADDFASRESEPKEEDQMLLNI